MMFWWWGNIFMAMWTVTTIWAGVTYADGKNVNGPIAWLGKIFDKTFGLDTCRRIPNHNQNLNDLKQPAYFCKQPASYPLSSNLAFAVNYEQPPNVLDSTGVSGVGGIHDGHITGLGSKAVDPITYITRVLTGSTTGSIAKGEYDKKRFKQGTPYITQQTGNTVGYYYSTDAKGQEVPLIPPFTGGATFPAAGEKFIIGGPPTGFNAVVKYTGGARGTVFTAPSGNGLYNNPASGAAWDPLNGFMNTAANVAYVQGPLSGIDKLKYKSFSVTDSGASSSSHPNNWTTR